MPVLLTVPDLLPSPDNGEDTLHPLIVYLHDAGSTHVVSGMDAAMKFLVRTSPHSQCIESGATGIVNTFIGIAPCCPANIAALGTQRSEAEGVRNLYWFKSCDATEYFEWNFAGMARNSEVELLVVELLADVLNDLPVDPARIYFVGSSAGAYGVLRLAELVPGLPAAVVPISGYYPNVPRQDHDPVAMAERLRDTVLWPMHCWDDAICCTTLPEVDGLYRALCIRHGVEVTWVYATAPDYHDASRRICDNPDRFCKNLLLHERRRAGFDAGAYASLCLLDLVNVRGQ